MSDRGRTALGSIVVSLGLFLLTGQAIGTPSLANDSGKESIKVRKKEASAGPRLRTSIVGVRRAEIPAPLNPLLVLYDQPSNSSNAAPSQNFEALYDSYDSQAADDFVVSAGFGWNVTTVFADGMYTAAHGSPQSMRVAFYQDAAGIPGALICDFPTLAYVEAPVGAFTMTLPGGCSLGSGIKWVSVVANLNFDGGGGQWYWTTRTVLSGNPSMWQNPGGGFGVGCNTWGTRTTCLAGQTAPDMAFRLEGSVLSCSTNADCADSNVCNGIETCVAGTCVPGTPVVCDDGLFCTIDNCVPATGACTTAPNPCSDGNSCTVDSCNEATDSCTNQSSTPVRLCNTTSIVIPATGTAAGVAAPYPSPIVVAGLPTQASVCSVELLGMNHTWEGDVDIMLSSPLGGTSNRTIVSDIGGNGDFINTNLTLTDGAATSLPTANGNIASGSYKPTNNGATDTFDTPAPAPTGLAPLSGFDGINPNGTWNLWVRDDADLDVGNISGGWCINLVVSGCVIDADCNDGNPCTTDTCSPSHQCLHTNNADPCSDGNICTQPDMCGGGVCVAGPPVNCDDNNPCTLDSCDPALGCVTNPSPPGTPCDDYDGCTSPDSCDGAGNCVAGPAVNCDDGNPCNGFEFCLNGNCVSSPPVPFEIGSPGFETGPNTAAISFTPNDADGLLWYATNRQFAAPYGVQRVKGTGASPAAEGQYYALLQQDPGAYSGEPLGTHGPFRDNGFGRIYARFSVTPNTEYTVSFQHAYGQSHFFCQGGPSNGAPCTLDADCLGGGVCREDPNLSVVEIVDMAGARFCVGGARIGGLCGDDLDCPSSTCGGVPPDMDPAAGTLALHTFVTPPGPDWQRETFNFRTGPQTNCAAIALSGSGRSGATAGLDQVQVRIRTGHFTCYTAHQLPTGGFPSPNPKAKTLCTPTNKNFEGFGDPHDHLVGFNVPATPFEPLISQEIFNQFGRLFVDVLTPQQLMLPSEKSIGSPPAPGFTSDLTDDFQCYLVAPSLGATFEPILGVRLEDQFGELMVDVKKPSRICFPVPSNGRPVLNPDDVLMCYLVNRVVGTSGHPPLAGTPFVSNRFGRQGLVVDLEPNELCVPSYREEPCDDGRFCTLDRRIVYTPEIELPPEPDAPPVGTETTCIHEWRYGPAFGSWNIDPQTGQNNSPCCEDDTECDDGNPCTRDTCYGTVHSCVFEQLDPTTCGSTAVPPIVYPAPGPCDPNETPALCNLTCIPNGPLGQRCPTPYQIFPNERAKGFADIHAHVFAEEMFGGGWMHGRVRPVSIFSNVCDGGLSNVYPLQHGTVATVVPVLQKVYNCQLVTGNLIAAAAILHLAPLAAQFGPRIMSEMFSKTEGTWGDAGWHPWRYSSPRGWTRWDTIVHHRVREDQLKQAYKDGLRLFVVALGGQKQLCETIHPGGGPLCEEMNDVDRQIVLAKQFAAANPTWVKLALTPQDAIDAMNGNKLTMVLAIETTDIFKNGLSLPPTQAEIEAAVDHYYAEGVRSVQIVHMTDGTFSGAAQSDPIAQLLQYMYNPRGPAYECHSESCGGETVYGFDLYQDTDGLCKNEVGLTAAGEILVDKLMAKEMLIDLSHTSERAMFRVWQKARANLYYPLMFTHSRFREVVAPEDATEYTIPAWMVQRIRRAGGIVGVRPSAAETRSYAPGGSPRVANICSGSSRSVAQVYDFGLRGLKVPMAIGTDFNAPAQHARPRFRDNSLPGWPLINRNGACSAGFKAEGVCQSKKESLFSQKLNTRYDTMGLADISLDDDLMADISMLGIGSDIAPLRDDSAEAFIRTWLRATEDLPAGPRVGPADLANDVDVTGVAAYLPFDHPDRNVELQSTCLRKYCPDSVPLGEACNFNGECVDTTTCSGLGLCGLVGGSCVCTEDSNCPGGYCKLNWPFYATDNRCEPKRAAGARCLFDKWCTSNNCHFFKCQ